MNGKFGSYLLDDCHHAQIADNYRICLSITYRLNIARKLFKIRIVSKSIAGHIHPRSCIMSKLNCLGKFFKRKITRTRAQTKFIASQIHRIRSKMQRIE